LLAVIPAAIAILLYPGYCAWNFLHSFCLIIAFSCYHFT